MISAWICRWAAVRASTAERRAASRTASAARSPISRGSPCSRRASASRAQRTASIGSDFLPPRRAVRFGRSSSITHSPCSRRKRVKPAHSCSHLRSPRPESRPVQQLVRRSPRDQRAGGGGHLSEDTASRCANNRGAVGVFVRIDADDEVDLICEHCHAFNPLPEGRGRFRSGKRRQDCDGTHPA